MVEHGLKIVIAVKENQDATFVSWSDNDTISTGLVVLNSLLVYLHQLLADFHSKLVAFFQFDNWSLDTKSLEKPKKSIRYVINCLRNNHSLLTSLILRGVG